MIHLFWQTSWVSSNLLTLPPIDLLCLIFFVVIDNFSTWLSGGIFLICYSMSFIFHVGQLDYLCYDFSPFPLFATFDLIFSVKEVLRSRFKFSSCFLNDHSTFHFLSWVVLFYVLFYFIFQNLVNVVNSYIIINFLVQHCFSSDETELNFSQRNRLISELQQFFSALEKSTRRFKKINLKTEIAGLDSRRQSS